MDPENNSDELLNGEGISQLTRQYYGRVRDVIARRYGNAIIPTLFKNLTKCKDIVQKAQESPGATPGEQHALALEKALPEQADDSADIG